MTSVSQDIIYMSGESNQQWQGVTSDKWRYAERKHYAPKDMMKTIEGVDLPFLGRKHFTPTNSGVRQEKLCLKPFPEVHNRQSSASSDPKIKTRKEFTPTSRSYGHREKGHLYQEGATETMYRPQVKTFGDQPNKKAQEVGLEKMMGKKKIIDSVEDQRNLISLTSLGDKPFKSSEYSSNFYQAGGLIPGSSINKRPVKTIVSKLVQEKNRTKGMTWKDRVKKEEKDEEEAAVKSLFDWEKTTLKEANPKWRDPDEVELEAPKVPEKKIEQKNVKKPAGKK